MQKPIATTFLIIICLTTFISPVSAKQKTTRAFGTLKEIHPKKQRLKVTQFNWDTMEPEEVEYFYNVRRIKLFNLEYIAHLKPGDEVEFEWRLWRKWNRKYLIWISKGSKPVEEEELLWDPNSITVNTVSVETTKEGASAENAPPTEETAP